VSEIFATGTAGNTLFAAQNPFQTNGAERSISGLDIPKAWTILFTEQIPFFREQHGWMGHMLGGWSISADYLLGSGQSYTPAQNGESAGGKFGDVFDLGFVNAFVGDSARPFYGNPNAPDNTVGMFAGDACAFKSSFPGLNTAGRNALCAFSGASAANANSLISVNQLNSGCVGTSCGVTPITANDVKFIINSKIAQQTFGTPFGNVSRNAQRDAISNIANASIFKTFNLGEHAKFDMHLTMNNAFNHFNFTSINPNMENAGAGTFGTDFANPSVTSAAGRTVWIGGRVTF
jgi:hypothetical protein